MPGCELLQRLEPLDVVLQALAPRTRPRGRDRVGGDQEHRLDGLRLHLVVMRLDRVDDALALPVAAGHPGVEKVYALQAGREIRVLVKPHEIDDDGAVLLSHEIAREIESHLEYPGQIKVTVIRESRAIDVATNKQAERQRLDAA